MDLNEIRQLIRQGRYEFSIHAQQERLEEDLEVAEIEEAIVRGEILEEYPSDPRGECCLILGYAHTQPIHAVYILRPPKWRDPGTRGGRP